MLKQKYNMLWPMNLQLFAADTGASGGAGAGEEGNNGGQEGNPDDGVGNQDPPAGDNLEIPKTKEELLKLLQSESDRRVSGALKKDQSKWQADYEAKLEEEKAEAEKLAKMTAAEKQKHLLDKQAKEIADKEKAIAAREMKLQKIDIFAEKKLPIKLVDYVQGETAEEVKANIDTFEKEWRAAIDEAVNEKLKGKTPFNFGSKTSAAGKTIAEKRNEKNKNNPYEDYWK